jgi:monofunctional biosynthetic peptidoglycan transglycosylase
MEAAAMHYYGVHAKDLDRKQACALAACLPAPLERNPGKATSALRKRQTQINALIPKLTFPDWAL